MNLQKFQYFSTNSVYETEESGEVVLDMDGDAITNNCGVSMMVAARTAFEKKDEFYGRQHADGTNEGVKWMCGV